MGGLTYHPLKVLEVVEETHDARSIVLEVPPELRETFLYKPGQHLQLHAGGGARPLPRCYSCSSIPGEPLRVTVKRVLDGRASNWLCGTLKAGDVLGVARPAGIFTPRSFDGDFLLYAGGSGITPVYSILRSALAHGSSRIRLVYANRDERSVIFGKELARLSREHPRRLQVIHWLDSVQGVPSQAQLAAFADGFEEAQAFICGPGVFMDATAAALHDLGLPRSRVHVERFVSLPEDADDAPQALDADSPEVEIVAELDGVVHTVKGRQNQIVLESLEAAGIAAPYSCRAGACAACMCHLEEGDVELVHNHVLTQDDAEQGWVLACQALPLSPRIRIKYPS